MGSITSERRKMQCKLTMRLGAEMLEKLLEAAEAGGVTPAEIVRRLIANEYGVCAGNVRRARITKPNLPMLNAEENSRAKGCIASFSKINTHGLKIARLLETISVIAFKQKVSLLKEFEEIAGEIETIRNHVLPGLMNQSAVYDH